MKKRIHLVHTGGTLGMMPTGGALAPGPFLAQLLEDVPELSRLADVDVEILMNRDSTEMLPTHWDVIGACLASKMDAYDGFVLIHGTDTMAYTAAALSYSLRGLRKPVVLTGSQRPLKAIPTDGRTNLVSAVDLARRDLPEVSIFFGRQLLRGNRARKVSAERYDAFESPNYPPLGRVGLDVDLHPALLRRPVGPFAHVPGFDPAVAFLYVWPGAPADALTRAVDGGARVLVVGAYGTGNVPGGVGRLAGGDPPGGRLRDDRDAALPVRARGRAPRPVRGGEGRPRGRGRPGPRPDRGGGAREVDAPARPGPARSRPDDGARSGSRGGAHRGPPAAFA